MQEINTIVLTERVHTIIFHLSRELPKALIYPWKQCRGISSATKHLTTTPSFGWFFSRTYGYLSIEARDLSVHIVNFSNFLLLCLPKIEITYQKRVTKYCVKCLCSENERRQNCLGVHSHKRERIQKWRCGWRQLFFAEYEPTPSNANAKA